MGKIVQLRTCRIDVRVRPSIRANLDAVTAHTRRTLTSVIDEALEDIIKKHTPKMEAQP